MHWLSLLLAGVYIVGAVAIATRLQRARRRLRHAALIAGAVIVSALLLVPALLLAGLQPAGWAPYAQGLAVVVLLVLAVAVFLNLRPVSRTERPRRILVIGAHPDDLELACGGSLARFVDNGHEVHALVMSQGAQGGHKETRAGEALAAAQLLDLHEISVRDFTDTRMSTEIGEMIRAIETMIELVEPDIILTHSRNDQHQDHHAVHLATLRAARRCSTILCYESPSVTDEFAARFFVDIGDYMDVKIAAVKEHANQSGKPYIDELKLAGKALHRGEQAKVGYAEGYEVVRALSDQLGTL